MWIFRFVGLRVLQAIPVLLGITLVAFLAIHLVPGDPVRIMLQGRASDAAVAEIHARLGMDQAAARAIRAVRGQRAVTGDLGTSIIQRAPVSAIVWERLVPSELPAGLRDGPVGDPRRTAGGLGCGAKASGSRTMPSDSLGTVSFAMPSFWIGLILILVLRAHAQVVPHRGIRAGGSSGIFTTCSCRRSPSRSSSGRCSSSPCAPPCWTP